MAVENKMTFVYDAKAYDALRDFLDKMVHIEATGKKPDGIQQVYDAMKRMGEHMSMKGKRYFLARNNKKTGNLYNSFRYKIDTYHLRTQVGFRRGKNGGNHAHLVDSGTAKRWTKKGWYRGSVSRNNPKHGSQFWHSAVKEQAPLELMRTMNALETVIRKNFNTAAAKTQGTPYWGVSGGKIIRKIHY